MARIGSRAALELRDAIAGTVPRARADGVAAGTVTAAGTETWVLLDGADSPTPMQATTCSAARGDRVSVRIRDGVATVTGNLTRPAQTAADVTAAVSPVATRVADVAGQVDGVAGDVARLRSLVADSATIGDLEAVTARVTALQAAKADVTDLEATNATVTDLRAKKADIDLANVSNAWIENGTIRDASISDAQILGVSANKLTAGTIDASRVNVTNLNADNITVGTINGKRIGSGSIDLDKLSQEVPTKEQLDKAKEELQGQIDGNIETFTVSVVPTLSNEPAKAWADDTTRKKHVGDVAYVVNKSSQQDGYAYRFGYDETNKSYGWTLIKDNDVTAALKRITDAEGSIDGLKTFETSTSKWMDETDEGLTQVRSRTTTLETQMGDKVSTTTFKELSDTVDEQSSTITTMGKTLSKKADGSTVTELTNTVNTVRQTAEGNSTKLSSLTKTVEGKADGSTVTTLANRVTTAEQSLDGFKSTVSTTYETKADASSKKSALETSISQTNDALALKAAKTDLDAATKRITAAETSIKANADSISLKASKTEVPGLVDVGGRNLARKTSSEWSSWITPRPNDTNETTTIAYAYPELVTDTPGVYTVSIEFEFKDVTSTTGQTASFRTQSSWLDTSSVMYWDQTFAIPWNAKFVNFKEPPFINGMYTYTAKADGTTSRQDYAAIYLGTRADYWASGSYRYRLAKVEKGNVATQWTPAPEDVQGDISAAKQAAIDVSAEVIKSFVKSAGGETSYKQTDSGFTWTTTSPMTQVADSTARANASNAATAASNAATAASDAKAAASKAQTTANSASSAASAAQDTAADAATKATAFMDYNETESGKLTLGYRAGGRLSGARATLGTSELAFKAPDGTELASFGTSGAVVGPEGSTRTTVGSTGMEVSNGGKPIARLGSSIELYTGYDAAVGDKKSKVTIGNDSLSIRSGDLSRLVATTGEPVFGSYSENVIDGNGMTQRQYDKAATAPMALLRFGPNAATYDSAKAPGIGSHMGSFHVFADSWGPTADSLTGKAANSTVIRLTTDGIKVHTSGTVDLGRRAEASYLTATVTFSDISESDIDDMWDSL